MQQRGQYTSLGQASPSNTLAANATRKRELMAASAFILSLAGFVGQTELLASIAKSGYQKPLFTMYVTHSCMLLLLPLQIVVLWLYKRDQSWSQFYHRHTAHLKHTACQIANSSPASKAFPSTYFLWVGIILSVSLNVAGASWYIAVGITSSADVTAIYNCSTFFAYGFSILLLKESFSLLKAVSVVISIIGVFIIAYMGVPASSAASSDYPQRMLGNTIIAVGTVLYGLYEVLYKRIACPPQSVSAKKQAAFANLVGSIIGVGTLALMWPVLIIAHFTGGETFELPPHHVLGRWLMSLVCNVTFSGAFLILMSLTSPVLGSASSLVATFMVPVVDYFVYKRGLTAWETIGGIIVMIAFALMIWASQDEFEEDGIEEDDDYSRRR